MYCVYNVGIPIDQSNNYMCNHFNGIYKKNPSRN